MAGDWIKVEHATVDKPEISRIAELLGVSANEALGLMVGFWVWCDRHSRNGVVTHMSRQTLDNVTHTPGFAACLIDVGWAKIDDATGIITLPNHERHNGSPAKTRALGRDRSVTQRSRESNADPVTRLDKTKSKRERVQIAAPTDKHRELATKHAVNCDEQWPIYLDWNKNAKDPHSDLSAGFSNWLRRAREFQRPVSGKPTLHDKRAATAAAMYGQRKETNAEPTDITAEVQRVA